MRIQKTALIAALCLASTVPLASASGLQFKANPTGQSKVVNCNKSSISGAWTCKCTGSGACTYLQIACDHVTENYYTCEKDETEHKPAGQSKWLQLR